MAVELYLVHLTTRRNVYIFFLKGKKCIYGHSNIGNVNYFLPYKLLSIKSITYLVVVTIFLFLEHTQYICWCANLHIITYVFVVISKHLMETLPKLLSNPSDMCHRYQVSDTDGINETYFQH
jgi:hypothetical protein